MVIIDIETTGLSKKDCGICQLSMVKTNDNFEVIDTFNHYIKPKPTAISLKLYIDNLGILILK